MNRDILTAACAGAALLAGGAIFGFFYAWVCSTMWGLDNADPRVAIAAMQAMNASVRNIVFAPAFFGTPVFLGLAASAAYAAGYRQSATAFGLAGIIYALGGMGLTMAVNVPMNEALARVAVPDDIEKARAIWMAYSPRWQVFNIIRTCVSGVSLLLAGYAIFRLRRSTMEASA